MRSGARATVRPAARQDNIPGRPAYWEFRYARLSFPWPGYGANMKYRATFFAGAAVGYLFGTRAGRERYEQIKQASRKIAEHPTVQQAAGVVRAQAGDLADTAKEKVGGKLPETIGERIPGLRKPTDTPTASRTGPQTGAQAGSQTGAPTVAPTPNQSRTTT
jgi:hypothetical protein